MARYRLSDPAKADIAAILRASEERHGRAARIRDRALLTAALRHIARDPQAPPTADRGELVPALRSLHIRHCRDRSREAPAAEPVHVIVYRAIAPGVIEIARVLHERIEPGRRIGAERPE